jgi:hypothetical protein
VAAWAAVGEAPLEYLRTMLSHGGAASAELSCNLGPVAGRAQLIHEGLQLLLLVLCPAAMCCIVMVSIFTVKCGASFLLVRPAELSRHTV